MREALPVDPLSVAGPCRGSDYILVDEGDSCHATIDASMVKNHRHGWAMNRHMSRQ